ncbi:unnamed protein product [Urochloa decumbens]|uniref:Uncharacterized protein n=1 Tax=Urochloa decumbens TaxID=240449 RepID=A0ABC9DFP4_9POAL
MAMARVIASMPVILLLIMVLLAVSGAARPLGGDFWVPAARETIVSSDDDGVMQYLRQMYQQQLGPGRSCGTNSSNGGCPRRP